jgi:hypothetical protein
MSSPKSLSDEQISQIKTWVDEGDGFPEIQRKLREEYEIRITYLETRFLLEDLKIELKPTPEPVVEAPLEEPVAEPEAESSDAPDEPAEEGQAKVSMDTVLRPGAILSGKVDFGGGHTASWWLDQMGRLGMDASDPAFQPSEAQMITFQSELRALIQRSGL